MQGAFPLPPPPPPANVGSTKEAFIHTAQRQYRTFETNIPRKEIARPKSNLHIHVSVSDFSFPRIGLSIVLQENMWTDPGNI